MMGTDVKQNMFLFVPTKELNNVNEQIYVFHVEQPLKLTHCKVAFTNHINIV